MWYKTSTIYLPVGKLWSRLEFFNEDMASFKAGQPRETRRVSAVWIGQSLGPWGIVFQIAGVQCHIQEIEPSVEFFIASAKFVGWCRYVTVYLCCSSVHFLYPSCRFTFFMYFPPSPPPYRPSPTLPPYPSSLTFFLYSLSSLTSFLKLSPSFTTTLPLAHAQQ